MELFITYSIVSAIANLLSFIIDKASFYKDNLYFVLYNLYIKLVLNILLSYDITSWSILYHHTLKNKLDWLIFRHFMYFFFFKCHIFYKSFCVTECQMTYFIGCKRLLNIWEN